MDTASYSPVYTAIDIGSNSFRILIGSFDGSISVIKKDLITVRLAEGMTSSCLITNDAISRAIKAFLLFQSYIKEYKVEKIRVCGTEAVRRAKNNSELRVHCHHILGSSLEVIDGAEEAFLTQKGIFHAMKPSLEKNSLIVDVGGGSTECIFSDPYQLPATSFPIGALTFTEKYFVEDPVSEGQINQAALYIEETIRSAIVPLTKFTPQVIGSGGTATALSALNLGLQCYDADRVQGSRISYPDLLSLFKRLSRLSAHDRSLLPGLDEGRGKIILGGALIYCVLMDILSTSSLYISDYGLLEGIFLSLIPETTHGA